MTITPVITVEVPAVNHTATAPLIPASYADCDGRADLLARVCNELISLQGITDDADFHAAISPILHALDDLR